MYSPTHLLPTVSPEPSEGKFSALMDNIGSVYGELSKENANTDPSASTRMYQVGSLAAREYNLERLISPEFSQAHRLGEIHIHDLDYLFTINCMTHDLGRILSGFDNGVGYIRRPKRIQSACALTAIILQSAQNNMFGGQAVDFFDKALAPYAELEYERQLRMIDEELESLHVDPSTVDFSHKERAALKSTDRECYQAMEALIYNLNTMKARSGNQVPFTSFNFGTDTTKWGRMISINLLKAFKAGLGNGEPPLFPNLCFRYKKGVTANPEDPNYDVYQLALEVMAVRMHPTIAFMDSSFNAPYGDEAGYMGCRTRVLANVNGEAKLSGRGNLAFVTINLPRIALITAEYGISYQRFLMQLDAMLELCVQQLLERYAIACDLRVEDLPFVMQYYMGAEGLGKKDRIEPAIKNGTLSVGFIGLAETLQVLLGEHHGESEDAFKCGLDIVQHMRDAMDKATEKYKLNFTLLATPAEGLSGRFTRMDRKMFGDVPGITDKGYYTNSFHLPVDYACSYVEKIEKEAPFHAMTNAGHISYVELPSPPKGNLECLDSIIRLMDSSNMGYAGINFPSDFCPQCKLTDVVIEGSCPKCGCPSEKIKRVRRITGYMSDSSKFNEAKYAELQSRVTHFGKRRTLGVQN